MIHYRSFSSVHFSDSIWLKRHLLLLSLLSWTGCITPAQTPRAEESQYFYTVESGFHINAREAIIRYTILLNAKASIEVPLFLDVRFENPADPGDPYLKQTTWPAGEESMPLVSPPLQGLEATKTYRVRITIFEDPARNEALDQHEILIPSNIESLRYRR